MKRIVALTLLLSAPVAYGGGRLSGSKHDLSVKGPGPYRAETETDACLFCHISHNSSYFKLSSRPDPTAQHRPYASSTMKSKPGAPTGASRICLSCHDGTIALGQLNGNRKIRMVGGDAAIALGRRSRLGTDLRGTHPVSMRPVQSGKLHRPPPGDPVALDAAGEVQCTSCHDPHDEWRDPKIGKFLVKPADDSAICVSCHSPSAGEVTTSSHLTALPSKRAGVRASAVESGTMSGCSTCHVSHNGEARGSLMKSGRLGDDLCLTCHGDSDGKAVGRDLAKASTHGRDPQRRHDAAEGPQEPNERRLPESSIGVPRHATCVDCHNPHSSGASSLLAAGVGASLAGGPLAGVWGIDLTGERVDPARYEYEICFKCHGDSANKPQGKDSAGSFKVRRALPDTNLRMVFGQGSASSHPVASPRKGVSPSLKPEVASAMTIRCSDCHSSDTARLADGSGVRGPHGSTFSPILELQYLTNDFTPEGAQSYALCYKCHDREILLSERSTFTQRAAAGAPGTVAKDPAGKTPLTVALHQLHVVRAGGPCSACHDAHGVSAEAGNARNNAHLISFDLSIVKGVATGEPRYEADGVGSGSCTLSCHGIEHGPARKAGAY